MNLQHYRDSTTLDKPSILFHPSDFPDAPVVRVRKGQCITHEGDTSNKMAYFIETGRVKVVTECFDGTQTLLYTLQAGNMVGELAMMGLDHRSASVYALEDMTLLSINEALWDQCMQKPDFSKYVYAMLLHRFIETTKVVSRLGQSTVLERLGTYLLTLPQWHGHSGEQITVRLPSHAQLACMLNCTRERVTTIFRKLYDAGAIIKHDSEGSMALHRSKIIKLMD